MIRFLLRRKRLIVPLVSLPFCVLLYSALIEPNILTTKYFEMRSPRLKKDCTIVFMADTHMPVSGILERSLFAALQSQKPDLILIGGDFSEYGTLASYSEKELAKISRYGRTIMVMGNADQCGSRQCIYCSLSYPVNRLKDEPFSILRNQILPIDGFNMRIYGLDDPVTQQDDSNTISNVPDSTFNLLLLHCSYRLTDNQKDRFNLICSAHTHGGQIIFDRPFLHRFDPAIDERYIRGFFKLKHGTMIVTSGVGTSVLPLRLGVPPEIIVIKLKKGGG